MAYFSNSSEGMQFLNTWCANCVYGTQVGDQAENDCSIWMAHEIYNGSSHQAQNVLDLLIPEVIVDEVTKRKEPRCRFFHRRVW